MPINNKIDLRVGVDCKDTVIDPSKIMTTGQMCVDPKTGPIGTTRVSTEWMAPYFSWEHGNWAYDDRTKHTSTSKRMPAIEKVVFNPPATIVIWNDGTKTIVKAKEKGRKKDKYSKEYGLAMAIAKRYFGNRSRFLKAVEDGKSYD